ncbi:unnamed protein product [Camellia sinensis]
MEYKEVEGVQGGVPKIGAIFMSNIATKEECFRRKILGLPSAQANFVKQVKAGMVLFLFEFERRELHGVFRASSNGVMNLVPHAFSSSGSQFPAQVRFTPIWYCSPLSEHEFRDAIKENYFSRNKFNFGLSEDQVRRLLWLFNSRKLENEQLPERHFSRQASEPIGKDRREAGNDRIFVRNSAEKFVKEDGLNPSINTKFYEYSSSNVRRPSSNARRLYDDRFLKSDGTENELSSDNYHGNDILTEQPRTSLGKRRRDHDGRSSMQDRIEYDCDVDNICIDHPGDSLCKSGREAEESQLLPSDRIEIKRIMDRNIGSIFTSEYLADSLAEVQRATDDVRFPIRDILGDKRTPDNGFGLVTSTDHLENPAIKARRTTDDHRFFMDCRVENNCNLDNGLEPIISTDCQENLLGGVRRASDDGKFVLNGRMESEHHVDNGLRPFLLAKYLENPLGKVEKETDNAMFLMSDRVGMGNEHFANQLDYGRKENDRDRFLARMSMENEHKVGNNLGQVISTVHSGYPLDKIRRVADEGMSLNIDRVDNAFNMENCFGPPLSTGFSDFCQSRQNPSFYSSKPQLETNYSFCQDQQKPCSAFPRSMEQKTFEFSYPTSHDAIVTRAFPYDPEFPDIHHRRSSSVAVDCTSSHSVRDFTPHRSSFGNVFDSSVKRASPYRLEAKDLSQNLDVASNCVNKVSLPTNPNHSLLSGGYGKVEARVTGHEVYKEPLFSKSSSASIPISRSEIYERQAKSPYVEFGKHGDASQSRYKHKIPQHETNQAFRIQDAPSFDNNMGDLQCGSSHEKSYNSYIEYYQHSKGMCADSKSERISVFSRLTSASELPGQENDTSDCDECDTDASVDQVMDMLHQRLNHRIMKPGKLPLVRRHDMENMRRTKRRDTIYNQIACDKLTMMKNDLEQVIDDNCDDIAKETRVVDFRRRSETREIQGGTKTKGSVKTVVDETKGSVQKPEHKRRKLVRPVFGKKEQLDEGLSSDGNSNLQLSCDDSVKSQENESRSSPNDLLVQLTSATSCGGDSANVEQSSNCREKNSENCELVWLVSCRKELFHEDINNNASLNLQLYSHEGSITKENTESCGNICEVGNTNGDSSDCRERNAVNGGSLLTCDEGKDGKKSRT